MRKSYFLFFLAACLCLALALPALSDDRDRDEEKQGKGAQTEDRGRTAGVPSERAGKQTVSGTIRDINIDTKMLTLEDDQGNRHSIKLQRGTKVTSATGEKVNLDDLNQGDQVTVHFRTTKEGEMIARRIELIGRGARAGLEQREEPMPGARARGQRITGTIERVESDQNILIVRDEQGQEQRITIDPNRTRIVTAVTDLSQLKPGERATIMVRRSGQQLLATMIVLEEVQPGRARPGIEEERRQRPEQMEQQRRPEEMEQRGQIRTETELREGEEITATVVRVDAPSQLIVLRDEHGHEFTLNLASDVKITSETGTELKLEQLQPGTQVRTRLEREQGQLVISEINLSRRGAEAGIEPQPGRAPTAGGQTVRGRVVDVDATNNMLTIRTDEGCELRVSLEQQTQFGGQTSGQTVRLENLKPGDEVTLTMRCLATNIQVQGQRQQNR